MKDNISIVMAAIIGTILVVLIPLISILDRQDNMSYNVVLTATTNFVDEVKSKGFIDKASYEKYLDTVAATGNVYDMRLEVYKKFTYKNLSDENIEDELLYNTKDITGELNDPADEMYDLEVGDEFYISIENTNIPSSVLMYNYISGDIGSKEKKIININYGGTINNKDWEAYEEAVREGEHYPTIIIGVPNDGKEYKTAESKYIFNTSVSDISLNITLKNFTGFIDPNDGSIVSPLTAGGADIFKSYLDVIGISESNVQFIVNDSDITHIGTNDYKVAITMKILDLPTATTDVVIRVLPGLGTYENKHISTGKESEVFCFTGDETVYDLKIEGPYYHNGRLYNYASNDTFYVYKNSSPYHYTGTNMEPYFEIKYQNILEDQPVVESAILTQLTFNGATGAVESAVDNRVSVGAYNRGTITAKVHFTNENSGDCYVKLPTGWLPGLTGYDYSDINKYYKIAKDTEVPTGEIKVYKNINVHHQIPGTNTDVVNSTSVQINVENLTDNKSGIYKIWLSNDNSDDISDYTGRDINPNTKFVDWTLKNTTQDILYYKVEDNVGNITAKEERSILYDAGPEILGLKLTKEASVVSDELQTNTIWYNQDILYVQVTTSNSLAFDLEVKVENEDQDYEDTQLISVTSPGTNTFSFNISSLNDKGSGKWIITATALVSGTNNIEDQVMKGKYQIDNEDPIINTIDITSSENNYVDINSIRWYKRIGVTTSASDNYSGFKAGSVNYDMYIDGVKRYDTIVTGNAGNNTTADIDINSYNYQLAGFMTLKVTAKDKAENFSSSNKYIYIDQVGPEIELTKELGKFIIEVTDNESSIANVKYTICSNDDKDTITLSDDTSSGIKDTLAYNEVLYSYSEGGAIENNLKYDIKEGDIRINLGEDSGLSPAEISQIQSMGAFMYFVQTQCWFSVTTTDRLGNINTYNIQMSQDPPEIEIKDGYDTDANGRIGIWTKIVFDSTSDSNLNEVQYAWSNNDTDIPTSGWVENYDFKKETYTDEIERNYRIGDNIDIMQTDDSHTCLWIKAKNNKDIASEEYVYEVKEFERAEYFSSVDGKDGDYIGETLVYTNAQTFSSGERYSKIIIKMAIFTSYPSSVPDTWPYIEDDIIAGSEDVPKFTVLKPTQSNSQAEQIYYYLKICDKVGNVETVGPYSITIDAPDITHLKLADVNNVEEMATVNNNIVSSPRIYVKDVKINLENTSRSITTYVKDSIRKVSRYTSTNLYSLDNFSPTIWTTSKIKVSYFYDPDGSGIIPEKIWTTTEIKYKRSLF